MKEIILTILILCAAFVVIELNNKINTLIAGNQCANEAKIWIDTKDVLVYSPQYRDSVEKNFISHCK